MILETLLDYFRILSYVMVVLTSIFILLRKGNGLRDILVSDIIMGIGLILVLVISNVFNFNPPLVADVFLTPTSIIWATIHFYVFVKGGTYDLRK